MDLLLSNDCPPSTSTATSASSSFLSSWKNFATTSKLLFIVVLLSLTNGSSVQCFAILNTNNDLGSRIQMSSKKQNINTGNTRRRERSHLLFDPIKSNFCCGGGGGSSSCANTGTTSTALPQSTNNNNDSNAVDDISRGGGDEKEKKNESPSNDKVQTEISSWPCMDKLDKYLIRISLPVIGNNAISPLIGAVDLFWVNRMGNALAVAGQAAANQVFNSVFWFTSFLPSGA